MKATEPLGATKCENKHRPRFTSPRAGWSVVLVESVA
jgi:hypothetical protein